MNFKIAFYLGALALSVASLYLFPGKWLSLLSWSLIGLFTAFSALNICHDAIHGSISTNQKTNKFFSSLFNLLGANDFVWDYSHNKVHHSFTNVQGQDEDVDAIPFVRTSPHQAHKKYHKYQVYYAPFFYSLATLSWVFVKDFVKIAQGQIGETTMKIERRDVVRLIAYKLAYYTLFLIIPLLVLPYSITWILAGFIISHLIEGFTIGIIFMLAHLVESVDFPMPDGEGKLQDNWAVHQLKTTSNFAIKSKFVFFLTGGLNFQVEHHLFPDVCHVHYPAISKIVAETAVEYGLPYHANRTLTGAIRSHVRFLKQMGSAATV
ncbi:acyl-CoA desaturase [bacterium]|nr:acyl-CoA desaturase [bacterium]